MRDILEARLATATKDRDALAQRRAQLMAAREQITAQLNAAEGRVAELTELLALTPPAATADTGRDGTS